MNTFKVMIELEDKELAEDFMVYWSEAGEQSFVLFDAEKGEEIYTDSDIDFHKYVIKIKRG